LVLDALVVSLHVRWVLDALVVALHARLVLDALVVALHVRWCLALFHQVDFRNIGYRDEPFIMVQQASQVFYVKDPTSEHWYVILHRKKQGEAIDDIENGDPCSFTPMIINKDDDALDDVHATRKDHSEGIYI